VRWVEAFHGPSYTLAADYRGQTITSDMPVPDAHLLRRARDNGLALADLLSRMETVPGTSHKIMDTNDLGGGISVLTLNDFCGGVMVTVRDRSTPRRGMAVEVFAAKYRGGPWALGHSRGSTALMARLYARTGVQARQAAPDLARGILHLAAERSLVASELVALLDRRRRTPLAQGT